MNKLPIVLVLVAVVGCAHANDLLRGEKSQMTRDTDLGEATDFDCARAGNGAWPHPLNCSQFYLCFDNVNPHLWECTRNLFFNTVYNGCDFEANTDCGDRLKPGQELPPFTCPTGNGLYPLTPTSCGTAYYKCTNGIASVEVCPGVDIFDSTTSSCVDSNTAPCIPTKPTTVKPITDIDLGEADFDCDRAGDGTWPHPINCWQFYQCHTSTIPHLWECRSNLLFNLKYNGCDFDETTDCGDRLRPGEERAPYICPSNGLFPITPQSCSTAYYSCINGVATVEVCPGVDIFDSISKTCVSPSSAPCTPTTTAKPSTAEPFPFECPEDAKPGYIPSPYTCSQFYYCDGYGNTFFFTCPPGLVFNPSLQACDFPTNVPNCNTGF